MILHLLFHHLVSLNFFFSLQVNQKSRFSQLSKEMLLTVFISNQGGNTIDFLYWLDLRFPTFSLKSICKLRKWETSKKTTGYLIKG